jgi:hypothetical protein
MTTNLLAFVSGQEHLSPTSPYSTVKHCCRVGSQINTFSDLERKADILTLLHSVEKIKDRIKFLGMIVRACSLRPKKTMDGFDEVTEVMCKRGQMSKERNGFGEFVIVR